MNDNHSRIVYRCQCGKPEYAIWAHTAMGGFKMTLGQESDLHFKRADRFCARCGAALCEDCCETVYLDDDYGVISNHKTYCRTCAELEE